MKPRIRIRLAGLLALLPASAIACPGLEVSGLWIREAPPAASTMVAYMDLSNTGTQPLVIDHIAGADFGGSMLHSTVVVDGISKMRHVEPARSVCEAPQGLHVASQSIFLSSLSFVHFMSEKPRTGHGARKSATVWPPVCKLGDTYTSSVHAPFRVGSLVFRAHAIGILLTLSLASHESSCLKR